MRNLLQSVLPTICALAICGCASNGKAVRPVVCPKPTEPPASLMQPPTTGQKVRAELFEPQTTPTRK